MIAYITKKGHKKGQLETVLYVVSEVILGISNGDIPHVFFFDSRSAAAIHEVVVSRILPTQYSSRRGASKTSTVCVGCNSAHCTYSVFAFHYLPTEGDDTHHTHFQHLNLIGRQKRKVDQSIVVSPFLQRVSHQKPLLDPMSEVV